ncbi:hypothetical protein GLOIN_2v1836189 [Rhizophagus irregularis DAOM 181602=DAOM 197198]|nr:hypothetical protein GLOIN_2v1836189 [Rhizophagus irregularis DAOM 181602=DAOM 197198]
MLSRVKKQKENTELPRTSESVVKAGKVEISIKRGQKSELSIYDEAAGKSTKSQIPSNALKRIEPRVWSLDDFEMGSPLGVSVEKTICYPEAEQGFQQVETEVIDAHLIASSNTKTQPFRNRNNETVLNLRGDSIKENYLEEICLEAAL